MQDSAASDSSASTQTANAAQAPSKNTGWTGRARWIGMALICLGALGLWGASRLAWVTVHANDDKQGPVERTLVGAVWSPISTAVALALVAALIALLVLRRRGRQVLGVIIALIGVAAMWPPLQLFLTSPDRGRAKDLLTSGQASQRQSDPQTLTDWAQVTSTDVHHGALVLSLVAALVVIIGAVVVTVWPGRDRPATSRYDTATARREALARDLEEDGSANRVLWDAMDLGVDPTTDDAAAAAEERTRTKGRGEN